MASVTSRIAQIEQPCGGFIALRKFETIQMDDKQLLYPEEKIHAKI